MKVRLVLINTLLFLCVLSQAFSTQAQTGTGGQTAAEWKRYELGKGSFSVLLPGKPEEDFKEAPASDMPISMYTYSLSTKDGTYVAQYNIMGVKAENWSEATLEVYYDGVWAGISGAFNDEMERSKLPTRASLIEKRKIKFSGYDGRELSFTLGNLKGRVLMAVVGRYAFSAMVIGTESMPEADRERFFNSFTIKASNASR